MLSVESELSLSGRLLVNGRIEKESYNSGAVWRDS